MSESFRVVFRVAYKDCEFYINKKENYTFIAKCGNNSEMHNHNDIGCFEFISGGKKIISDLGAGEYTYEYFNDFSEENGRYSKKIFVCGSWSHSVPIVKGRPQVNGKGYEGEIAFVDDKRFSCDIAKAYDGGVDKLTIDYELKSFGIDITYDCEGVEKDVVFRFITEILPSVSGATVKLGSAELKSFSGKTPKIEEVIYQSHKGKTRKAYTIDFKRNKSSVKEKFSINLI